MLSDDLLKKIQGFHFKTRHLANDLFVDTRDRDFRRLRRRDRDAGRDRIDDVVRVAELELQVLALHRRAVTDAVDLIRFDTSVRAVPYIERERFDWSRGATVIAPLSIARMTSSTKAS